MSELSHFHYNTPFVYLSIAVAIFAAYTAFEIAEGTKSAPSLLEKLPWLSMGGLTLGGGIWSMHLIGMLALQLDIPVRYDVGLTIGSLAIASLASGFVLFQVAQPVLDLGQRCLGAVVMGSGISAMHYMGMAAVHIPATMEMNRAIVVLSVAIAIGASAVAQWILRRFEQVDRGRELWHWCASSVMGAAIASMHYVAMFGVTLTPDFNMVPFHEGIDTFRLAELVGSGMFLFCGTTLTVTLSKRRRALQETLQDLQTAQMQLIQAEKLSSVGQLSAGISHEINNPLAFLKGNLIYVETTLDEMFEMLAIADDRRDCLPVEMGDRLDDLDWDFVRTDLPKSIQSMHHGIDRIQGIVKALEVFTSCNESERKSIDLCKRIDDALKLLSQRLSDDDSDRPSITIERQYENLPLFECNSGELLQAIFSLLENSVEAIERRWHSGDRRSGHISIAARMCDTDGIQIEITDTGEGCNPQSARKLFEPFFSTKDPGAGTGLGLTLALQAVRQHGGTLKLIPQVADHLDASGMGHQTGMRAEIVLPIQDRDRTLPTSSPPDTSLIESPSSR